MVLATVAQSYFSKKETKNQDVYVCLYTKSFLRALIYIIIINKMFLMFTEANIESFACKYLWLDSALTLLYILALTNLRFSVFDL
jgi:hypothetical protein